MFPGHPKCSPAPPVVPAGFLRSEQEQLSSIIVHKVSFVNKPFTNTLYLHVGHQLSTWTQGARGWGVERATVWLDVHDDGTLNGRLLHCSRRSCNSSSFCRVSLHQNLKIQFHKLLARFGRWDELQSRAANQTIHPVASPEFDADWHQMWVENKHL